MSAKDWWGATGFLIVSATIIVGVVFIMAWDYNNDKKEFEENCSNIVKTFGAKEYLVDEFGCYILKDGKIVEVKL